MEPEEEEDQHQHREGGAGGGHPSGGHAGTTGAAAGGRKRQRTGGGGGGGGARREAAVASTAKAGVDELWAEFERVRKNRAACLQFLVGLTQTIERLWVGADDPEAARQQTPLRALVADGSAEEGEGSAGGRAGEEARKEVIDRVLLLRRCLEGLRDHHDADLKELARLAEKIKEENIPRLSLKHFLGLFLPIERKFTRGLADHEFLIQRVDDPQQPAAVQKIPLVLVLDNLRSAFNVGAIFRTAECFGVQKIFLCGYTATPNEEKTLRTTMNAHNFVPWEWHQRTSDVIDMLTSGRYTLDPAPGEGLGAVQNKPLPIVALETVEGQRNIYSYNFPSRAEGGFALVLGNERHGIEADILKRCTAIVSIPCVGVKNSLNVGVAFGICAYEISRQWHHESALLHDSEQ